MGSSCLPGGPGGDRLESNRLSGARHYCITTLTQYIFLPVILWNMISSSVTHSYVILWNMISSSVTHSYRVKLTSNCSPGHPSLRRSSKAQQPLCSHTLCPVAQWLPRSFSRWEAQTCCSPSYRGRRHPNRPVRRYKEI